MPKTAAQMQADRDRVFIACCTTGLVYCDTKIEEHGDYKRIAYLNYGTLKLDIDDAKSRLLWVVLESVKEMQARSGEQFPIAGNMTVTLGGTPLTKIDDWKALGEGVIHVSGRGWWADVQLASDGSASVLSTNSHRPESEIAAAAAAKIKEDM